MPVGNLGGNMSSRTAEHNGLGPLFERDANKAKEQRKRDIAEAGITKGEVFPDDVHPATGLGFVMAPISSQGTKDQAGEFEQSPASGWNWLELDSARHAELCAPVIARRRYCMTEKSGKKRWRDLPKDKKTGKVQDGMGHMVTTMDPAHNHFVALLEKDPARRSEVRHWLESVSPRLGKMFEEETRRPVIAVACHTKNKIHWHVEYAKVGADGELYGATGKAGRHGIRTQGSTRMAYRLGLYGLAKKSWLDLAEQTRLAARDLHGKDPIDLKMEQAVDQWMVGELISKYPEVWKQAKKEYIMVKQAEQAKIPAVLEDEVGRRLAEEVEVIKAEANKNIKAKVDAQIEQERERLYAKFGLSPGASEGAVRGVARMAREASAQLLEENYFTKEAEKIRGYKEPEEPDELPLGMK